MNHKPLTPDFDASAGTPSQAAIGAFFRTALEDNAAALRDALEVYPVLIEWKDPNTQSTALILAAKAGNAKAVGALLESGADIRAVDAAAMNALCYAAYYGYHDACLLLIRAGADPAERGRHGMSALTCAVAGDFPSLAERLERDAAEYRRDMRAGWEGAAVDMGTAKAFQPLKKLSLKIKPPQV